MKKTQLLIVIILAGIAAGCASHQYTRDDITDKRAFRHQLKIDNSLCNKEAQPSMAMANTQAAGPDSAVYDACMLAHGWRHRNSGEARFHATPAANAASAAQSAR